MIKHSEADVQQRKKRLLSEARWCFLNFGYEKTSLDDIAKRANLARTLLYKLFKNKQEIYLAVYEDWLVSRHPTAMAILKEPISRAAQLQQICHIMVVEPWTDMVATPMGHEFFNACEKLAPEVQERHRHIVLKASQTAIKDKKISDVFLLALDGLLADRPTPAQLTERINILIKQFIA